MSDTNNEKISFSDFNTEEPEVVEATPIQSNEEAKPKRFGNKKANIALIAVGSLFVLGIIAAVVFVLLPSSTLAG